ncbi:MAG TPA: bifunctional UDP-N-acetylglucosamine diphosphorylase/glucosamine-1-phosphate N-acetyltransferase GlmU [Gaiellaceae bacterium]|nr:bifunctional UDP-N-acetylglucosamine diphosphorylase/glucosamine-1-phosphate N-acetyltransferase GlmU [Gaiellaceae bacterium]
MSHNRTRLAAVVMAAGLGTRMRSRLPKHLHPLLGRRLVDWTIEAVRPLDPDPLVVVCSPESADAFDGLGVAVQERPLGTGDAVRVARPSLEDAEQVLVVSGDHPLLTDDLLRELVGAHRRSRAAATVLSFSPADPRAYGRIVRDAGGRLERIVEAADATPEQLAIREVNSSMYVFAAAKLWPVLERLEPVNAQGELYLTDAVRFLVEDGDTVAVHEARDPALVEGVNTRAELASAAAALRDRINERHLLAGVTIVDPQTTWIEAEVEIEPDVVVQPFTMLRGSTRVETGAEIGPHVVAVDAVVGAGALVGPFCYLRPGTVLEAGAKAGTFVEIKNSRIGARTKVPHLSYIGDADVGEDTNVAAANVTVNLSHHPGRGKGRTRIGRNVRTGVQNAFVAPVEIGDNAWIGAGSVITEDVPPDSLAIARARQVTKKGYVRGKRDR